MSPDLIAAMGGGFHTRCGAGVTSSPDGVALVSRHSVPRSARLWTRGRAEVYAAEAFQCGAGHFG